MTASGGRSIEPVSRVDALVARSKAHDNPEKRLTPLYPRKRYRHARCRLPEQVTAIEHSGWLLRPIPRSLVLPLVTKSANLSTTEVSSPAFCARETGL